MGGYGFLRFSLPMFPMPRASSSRLRLHPVGCAIIYTSLVALVQEDIKKLIAYSSVAHMGFVTMGIFAGNAQGIQGAIFQMISHGIVSGALFLCVGVVYDRMHTREIKAYGGLVDRMPRYALRLHGLHHGQCRPAGHVRLRRRVPDADRRVPGQYLGWPSSRPRRHPVGSYALWLYRRVIFGALTKERLKVDR
jgi:NADH-quinone oxidoreductase subunit M